MLASLLLACLPMAALPQQPSKADQFRKAYSAALRLEDPSDLDKAIRQYKDVAIAEFVSKADFRANGSSADLDQWVDSFIESWSRVFHSGFARNYDRYLQMMRPALRTSRNELVGEILPRVNQEHIAALQSRKEADWVQVRGPAASLLEGLEQVGDLYYIAFAANILGNCWNTAYNDDGGGDDKKALAAYEKFLAARKKLGLTQDTGYTQAKALAAELRARLGIPDPETGKVGERKHSRFEILPAEGEDWHPIPLQPAVEEKPGSIQHPDDLSDMHRYSWRFTDVLKVGSSALLPGFDPPVRIHRVSFGELSVDGGAERSKPFRLSTSKPVVVRFQRKLGDGRLQPYAILFLGGTDRDEYQGASLNNSVNDQSARIFFRSVAERTAKTPWGQLTLFDCNADGSFGYSELKLSGAFGMPKDVYLYRYDALLLGKSKHSMPFSRWFPDAKGNWFELRMTDYQEPDTIQLRKVAPRLGRLKVEFKGVKGVKLVSLVMVSQSSQTKGLTVDLMAGKGGGMEVPIGRYLFQQGLLEGPKGQEALIVPPEGLPLNVDLEEGKTETIALGSPFHLSAKMALKGRTLNVDGQTLVVVGKAGERYTRMVGAPLFGVEVQVKGLRKPGVLAGSDGEEIGRDWAYAYYPKDAAVQLKSKKPPLVRLFMKKHPWFGKLESAWVKVED